ncbi:hypothetical protein [Nocardia bhagyanarayanae]|uniref:DUF5709 domain-containing protein n=1 Tax=Nocardia bhagyanarayanae TaxID=1215925 RepID=A0A543FGP0_9NOCA|nr:hypothetical protein [Nocardia bhagyanarayanae]TQM33019.1 hypothetical protein FB390_4732 [Nocardia bhagyanarayanae]
MTEPIGEEPLDDTTWTDQIPSTTEQLDEDELDADPLEQAMDPPDAWSAAERYAQSPAEQRAGESIGERLDAEEPDVVPDQPPLTRGPEES